MCPFRVRSYSPVSNSQIFTVPSSELLASWVYCGWNDRQVTLARCPFMACLGGATGLYRSSIFTSAFGPVLQLANCSSRTFTCSSRLLIFFWSRMMLVHLFSSFFPSGSTSSRLSFTSSAKAFAVAS